MVHPRFFERRAARSPELASVEVAPKPGAYDNELSRFRYDVWLAIGERRIVAPPSLWLDWDVGGRWRPVNRFPEARVL